jgi:large subunit ribosomal protein L4e
MKAKILNTQEEIELPSVFNSTIRQDIVEKVYNAMFKKQRYTVYPLAGKQSSTGKQSHTRRKFKTLYGKGISRVPRKALWRRGDQFYWVGTFIPGTVKGRQAHPPKIERRERHINKKEKILAIKSCIAATASKDILKKNYSRLNNLEMPIIIKSQILEKKPKEFLKEFQDKINLVPIKKVRAGKGKTRGRKYKNTRKVLLILADKEKTKVENINIKVLKISQLNVKDLSLNGKPGKLAIYTEQAIKELENKYH